MHNEISFSWIQKLWQSFAAYFQEGNLLLRDGIEVTDQGIIGQKDIEDPIVLIDYEYACYYYRFVSFVLFIWHF